MRVDISVEFKTAVPIGQAAGMKMWEIGNYFKSIGKSTYLLQTQGDSESLGEAVQGLEELISERLGRPGGWDVIVLKISAEVLEQ